MVKKIIPFLVVLLLLLSPGLALAQTYSFSLDRQTVDVFYNEDGTAAIEYEFVFSNDASAGPIDYVDVGLPNSNFDEDTITAEVDGDPITDISASGFQGEGGSGVALGLGTNAIQPGETGTVRVSIPQVSQVLYIATEGEEYASAVFSPTWFGSQYVHGSTDLTVSFHLPPGVQPEEPRWHEAPPGFPAEPERYLDEEGRVTYTWQNPQARGSEQYFFGASFPQQYVPSEAVLQPSFSQNLGVDVGALLGILFCAGFFGIFALVIFFAFVNTEKRKLQYLPPKISIEGHGIKRGLTAVEAAILMEEPLDKILTMILFGVIKKNAASVRSREPLDLEIAQPVPEGLHPYEAKFLDAFKETKAKERRQALQQVMIDLVNEVSQKMKGFSRKETVTYYQDIMKRAWEQVEAADTPEVKSEKLNELMEWTMLDRNYDDRTREVFRGGPVFVPIWWPRYDPTFNRPSAPSVGGPISAPTSLPTHHAGGGGVSLPNLPGSDFAASVVRGVQDFSGNVIGNINEFTGRVTEKTNPAPVATRSSSGSRRSGGGCACACACAGCACACAGGGR